MALGDIIAIRKNFNHFLVHIFIRFYAKEILRIQLVAEIFLQYFMIRIKEIAALFSDKDLMERAFCLILPKLKPKVLVIITKQRLLIIIDKPYIEIYPIADR